MNRPLIALSNLALSLLSLFSLSAKSIALPQETGATQQSEARAAAESGNVEQAMRNYRKALSQTPRDGGLHLEFAELLTKQGRYPEAIDQYQRALEIGPRNEAAEIGLSAAYRQVHNIEEARATLKSAGRHHPKSIAVLAAIGDLEIEAQSFDAAIEALRVAVALAPSDTKTRNLLGTAYQGKGDLPEALAQFDKVLARDPENQLAHYFRAQIYADTDQNEKALTDMDKVAAAKPGYLPARALLAKILVRLKQCARAAEVLRPAIHPPALDTQSLFLLGNAYECAGQAEFAKSAREEFAAASQDDRRQAENEVQSRHLYEQANELARHNEFAEALGLLDEALEKNPKNAFVYSQQAKIYFSMREAGKAREAIQKALAIQPFQPDFLYVAGVIAASDGKLEDALASFEQVTRINPKEADAYFEIGRIWMQKNDRVKARQAFRRAAELEPNDSEYQRALKEALSTSP